MATDQEEQNGCTLGNGTDKNGTDKNGTEWNGTDKNGLTTCTCIPTFKHIHTKGHTAHGPGPGPMYGMSFCMYMFECRYTCTCW